MAEPYRYTASQALPLLRGGQLSVEDYAESLLSRIKQRDHAVQAWAFLDPEFVLNEARRLDSIPSKERGPLHGLPIGVKDVMLTKGTTSSGEGRGSILHLIRQRHPAD